MKDVSSHEMKCICNAEDRFSGVRAFFAEQVMLELHAQNH